MKARIIKTPLFFILLLISQAPIAQTTLSLDEAIQLALAHDPRIEEKKAFVRKGCRFNLQIKWTGQANGLIVSLQCGGIPLQDEIPIGCPKEIASGDKGTRFKNGFQAIRRNSHIPNLEASAELLFSWLSILVHRSKYIMPRRY